MTTTNFLTPERRQTLLNARYTIKAQRDRVASRAYTARKANEQTVADSLDRLVIDYEREMSVITEVIEHFGGSIP